MDLDNSRLRIARDKCPNILYFCKYILWNMIFVERSEESTIDRMKTVKNESCNTHNLYQWIKGIIPKINKKYITPFRIMMLHKRTTMNQLLHSGGLNLTYSRFTITFFYCPQIFLSYKQSWKAYLGITQKKQFSQLQLFWENCFQWNQ